MSDSDLFYEGGFTDDDFSNFRYGSEKYTEFLDFSAKQGDISKIVNMIPFCREVYKDKFGDNTNLGFENTIPMSASDKKEEKLAGYILTHYFMMLKFKELQMPDDKKIQFVQVSYNEAIKDPWVMYQIEAYFNGIERYHGFLVGTGFPMATSNNDS